MPSIREHLIFKALAALHEVRQESRDGPIKPSWQLRFCLAYLFTQSHGGREPFEYFWVEMRNVHPTSTDAGRYDRYRDLGRAMSSMCDGLGFNATPSTDEPISRPHCSRAVHDFWNEVQKQLDDGRPMPSPRIKRG
jgi:hypothetical protein